MPALTVAWYGPLAERCACAQEAVADAPATAAGLWRHLAARHRLPPAAELAVAVAVGDALVAWDHPLRDGDVVAFLPPVAGG